MSVRAEAEQEHVEPGRPELELVRDRGLVPTQLAADAVDGLRSRGDAVEERLLREEEVRVLVVGRHAALVPTLRGAGSIPPAVADSLAALAERDGSAYESSIRALVADFESREEFLEDVAVADTVLALQALAAERGIAARLVSPVLPIAR